MSSDYLAVIESSIPAEPPVGSVVLDKNGLAYQSYKSSNDEIFWATWKAQDGMSYRVGQKWGYLVIEGAPLKLLWKGDTK